jgi:hypothetical protein
MMKIIVYHLSNVMRMILLFHRIIIRKIIFIHMEPNCHHFHFIMHMKENNRNHIKEAKWVNEKKKNRE